MSPTAALAGFAIGILIGLTGMGGGSLMTPLLLWLGLPLPSAVGTDMIIVAVTKLVAFWQHRRQKNIAWPLLRWLLIGGAPAVLAGTLLLTRWGHQPEMKHFFVEILGIALMAAALLSTFSLLLPRLRQAPRRPHLPPLLWVVVGAAIGLVVGLTSIGAATLLAPLLLLFSALLPRQMVGTDIAFSLAISLLAGVLHLAAGTVEMPLVLNILLGSAAGVYMGSRLTLHVPQRSLRLLLAGVVFVVGAHWAMGS